MFDSTAVGSRLRLITRLRFGPDRPAAAAMGLGLALVVPAWGCAEQTCAESLSCHFTAETAVIDAGFLDTSTRVEAAGDDASSYEDPDAAAPADDVTLRPLEAGRDVRVSDVSVERPPPCDLDGSPATTPCQVSELYAVFVAPVGGLDSNIGSRLQPYSTLQAAVQFAAVSNLSVFACSSRGPFTGTLMISEMQKGIKIYGGYDCDTWQPNQIPTQLKGAAGDVPLQILDTSSVHVEGFEITAQSSPDPSGNSVAAYVKSSQDVELAHVRLIAGNGKEGADGEMRSNYAVPMALTGYVPVGVNGGAKVECVNSCRDGARSEGGKGGYGGGGTSPTNSAASGGEAGTPELGGTGDYDGKGGTSGGTCSIGVGHEGSTAPAAAPGRGASRHGVMTPAGWQPESGTAGATGGPGQGGGGGAGRQGSGGGSGGCGGCGGAGGTGGKGGGASFALLSYESAVTLNSCHLETGKGGRGGHGGLGEDGQRGGNGGAASPGCSGGGGGPGGAGGKGGGGAGGLSVGIAHVGMAPVRDDQTTLQVGDPGLGGDPGGGLASDAGVEAGFGVLSPDACADADTDAMSEAGVTDPTRGLPGIAAQQLELPVPMK